MTAFFQNKGLVVIVLAVYLSGVTTGSPGFQEAIEPIRIVRVGDAGNADQRRAFDLFELRLARWIEDLVPAVKRVEVTGNQAIVAAAEKGLALFEAKGHDLVLTPEAGLLYLPGVVVSGSYCLVKCHQRRFHVYLYTPGGGLDEIPMESAMVVRDVLVQSPRAMLPVKADGFMKLLRAQRSRVAYGLIREGQGSERGATRRWYNHWAVWAAAAGIVGIGVAAFAVRNGSASQQVHGFDFRVKID